MLYPQLVHLPSDYRRAAGHIRQQGLSRRRHASRAGLDLLSALVKAVEGQLPYFFHLPGQEAEVNAYARRNLSVTLAVHYLAVPLSGPEPANSFETVTAWVETASDEDVMRALLDAATELEAAATPQALSRLLHAVLLADADAQPRDLADALTSAAWTRLGMDA